MKIPIIDLLLILILISAAQVVGWVDGLLTRRAQARGIGLQPFESWAVSYFEHEGKSGTVQ
jgi:hypothetical protein